MELYLLYVSFALMRTQANDIIFVCRWVVRRGPEVNSKQLIIFDECDIIRRQVFA